MNIALTDIRMSEKCKNALSVRDFFVISLPPFFSLETAVQSHPDMLLFYLNGRLFVHEQYKAAAEKEFSLLAQMKPEIEIFPTCDKVNEVYPNDIIFNASVVGRHLFGKLNYLSPSVLEYAESEGLSLHNIKQGYSACSCCNVDSKSIITSDKSLAKAAEMAGLSVLLIEEGHISLPCHDYGFIGGACGLFNNTLYFIGDINSHPNSKEITAFAAERGVETVSLSDEPLSDCGKIIFI